MPLSYKDLYNKMSLIGVLLLTVAFATSNSERLHEQIYSSIEGGAACFRRLNGTHQAGCSSSNNGAVGVVHMITDVGEAEWLVTNSKAGQYVAVISTALFNDVVEIFMNKPDNVAGILIFDNTTNGATAFSQDSKCPNQYASDQDGQCPAKDGSVWNEKGTGLLLRDIPFPVFYLPESRAEEIDKIEECYKKFNLDKNNQKGNPLCSVQLNSFMFAVVNSEVCLRRSASSALLTATKVCDPMGDQNVYYSLFPRTQSDPPKKENITLVTARIDTASLFDGVSPGAASSVVGMVTLLTAAITLSQLIHTMPVTEADLYNQNILFTLFNGEAFDYIGSQRVAYDMSRGSWPPTAPLNPADIKLHVEVGQIGGSLSTYSGSNEWPFTAFAPYKLVVPEIDEFIGEMSSQGNANNITVTPKYSSYLPPSSLHSFRKILTNYTTSDNPVLPEMLITDHDAAFSNMFYNSALDDYENIGFVYHNISVGSNGTFITTEQLLADGIMKDTEVQVKISRVATALTYTLFKRVAGKAYEGNVTSSAHLVDEMLYCFLRSQSCRLLLAADYWTSNEEEHPAERTVPLYVGVAASPTPAPVFAGHLLALLAGRRLPVDKEACDAKNDPGFSYYWLKGWNYTGECYETTMNFSQAISPAFTMTDYKMSSGVYSTWTESVWHAMSARVFVQGSGASAVLAASVAALATLAALLATLWLRRHSELLFATDTVSDDATSGILRTVNC